MNFKKQELNKKFDKKYFALSNLLSMNQKNDTTKKEESTKNSSYSNTNTNSNANTGENSTNDNANENGNVNQENQTNHSTTNDNNALGGNNTTNNNSNTNTNSNTNNNSSENGTTNSNSSQKKSTQEKTTAKINDVIYPMYLPDNTYLTSQDTVDTKEGSRLILTFGGDSSFVLVEETAGKSDEGLVIPVSGAFDFLSDVIGVIGNKSLSWHSNGIDYYMTSDTLEVSELVEIARSVSVLPVSK